MGVCLNDSKSHAINWGLIASQASNLARLDEEAMSDPGFLDQTALSHNTLQSTESPNGGLCVSKDKH